MSLRRRTSKRSQASERYGVLTEGGFPTNHPKCSKNLSISLPYLTSWDPCALKRLLIFVSQSEFFYDRKNSLFRGVIKSFLLDGFPFLVSRSSGNYVCFHNYFYEIVENCFYEKYFYEACSEITQKTPPKSLKTRIFP